MSTTKRKRSKKKNRLQTFLKKADLNKKLRESIQRHGKGKLIALAAVVVVLSAICFAYTHMRTPPSPGQCSSDKECVWRVGSFVIESGVPDEKNARPIKWPGDLRIQTVGNLADLAKPLIEETIKAAKLNFPYKIMRTKKRWNVIMVVSDDFEAAFKAYSKALAANFGPEFEKILRAKNEGPGKNKCVSLGIGNTGTRMRIAEVLFVNPHYDLPDCMLNTLMLNLDTYVPEGALRFTELHHLLVALAYDPRIASAKTKEDVRAVYDEIFPEMLEKHRKVFPAPVPPTPKEYDVNPDLVGPDN